jgi:hypothetical protein
VPNFSGSLGVGFPRCRHFSLSLSPFQISTNLMLSQSQDQDFFAALTVITRVQIYSVTAFLQAVTFRSQYSTRCASCFPLSCFRSYPPIPEFLNLCLTDWQSFFGSSMKVNTPNGGKSLSRLRATSEPAVSVLLCRCTSSSLHIRRSTRAYPFWSLAYVHHVLYYLWVTRLVISYSSPDRMLYV